MSNDEDEGNRSIVDWRALYYLGDVPWSSHVRILLRRTAELQQLQGTVNGGIAVIMSAMSIVFTYSDVISDVLVMKQLHDRGRHVTLIGALFGASLCSHALPAYILGQGAAIVLSALLGLKPAVGEYRSCVAAPPRPGQILDSTYILGITRVIQIGTDLVPQGAVQSIIYLMMEPNERTILYLNSIISTCCAIGSCAARTDSGLDSNPRWSISNQ